MQYDYLYGSIDQSVTIVNNFEMCVVGKNVCMSAWPRNTVCSHQKAKRSPSEAEA